MTARAGRAGVFLLSTRRRGLLRDDRLVAMTDPTIIGRLSKTAKDAADAELLKPDVAAQEYLGELVTRAAEALGDAPSDDEVVKVEEAFYRLASTASGRDPLLLQEAVAEPTRITTLQLEAALVKLCPGFWPFC